MPKESLYCIPFQKDIHRQSNGVVYHCKKEEAVAPIESSSSSESSASKCRVCRKEFKDLRCLKIHKTKMHHWGRSYDDPDKGPRKNQHRKSTKPSKRREQKRKRSNNSSPKNHKRVQNGI